jgi:uncharacterized protein DUF6600/FecR-like protein
MFVCLKRLSLTCLFLLSSASIVSAQDSLNSQVLRSSLIEGDVTYWRSDLNQWVDLGLNAPLVEGDKVWVGRDGRAEIEFENGSTVRLAQNSGIEIVRLERSQVPGGIEIHLSGGLATFEVLSEEGAFQVTAPLFSARALKVSNFRAEVDSDGSGRLVVFEGDLEIESQPGRLILSKGETLQLLSKDPGRYYLGTNYQADEWDKWNSERDEYLAGIRRNTQAPFESGWDSAELDQYGSWYAVPAYGTVWKPHCDDNWMPFSSGRWTWYDSFGWTWISSEPWGWIPYHYGRWAHVASHGWCWVPGKPSSWCPGAVSWVQGSGWVAWMPLAPSEPWSRQGNNRTFVSANLNQGRYISYLPTDRFLTGSSSPLLSNTKQLLADGRLLSGQPHLVSPAAGRIPAPDALPRKFTNDDLEARRNVRDRMIRSTVPAGSLTENSALTSRSLVRQGGKAMSQKDPTGVTPGSGVQVIQGGSGTQRSLSGDVSSYSNGNPVREDLRRDPSRVIHDPTGSGSGNSTQEPLQSPPSSQGQRSRERVYRIYGRGNESAKSDASSASTSRDSAGTRGIHSTPNIPPGRSTSVIPSAPPSGSQSVRQPSSPAVSNSVPPSAHPAAQASGTSNQEGRSAPAHGRAGR